jgi:hypothetical protein
MGVTRKSNANRIMSLNLCKPWRLSCLALRFFFSFCSSLLHFGRRSTQTRACQSSRAVSGRVAARAPSQISTGMWRLVAATLAPSFDKTQSPPKVAMRRVQRAFTHESCLGAPATRDSREPRSRRTGRRGGGTEQFEVPPTDAQHAKDERIAPPPPYPA